jgi:hypothetical protein
MTEDCKSQSIANRLVSSKVSISYIGTEQRNEVDPELVAELELACFNVKLGAERSHGYCLL